jgi:hypothetical protein
MTQTKTMTLTVWREGNRIRDKGGTGYGDMVTDDMIWEHIAASAPKGDEAYIEFALAVLRLRAQERAAS